MKRLWIAAAFLSIVAGCCIWSQITIDQRTDKLEAMVSSARSYVEGEDYDIALEHAEKITDRWGKDYVVFSALMQHNDLHDLNIQVNMLPNYALDKNKKEYQDCCDEIIVYLEHIRESERANIGNVF